MSVLQCVPHSTQAWILSVIYRQIFSFKSGHRESTVFIWGHYYFKYMFKVTSFMPSEPKYLRKASDLQSEDLPPCFKPQKAIQWMKLVEV